MCGLAGEIRFDGRRADVVAVERACEVLEPRGPDGGGTWADGPIALGHRRLSIIDLTPAGSQPMVDPQLGLTTVFNGCIYNYESLRDTLRGLGHSFSSHSDTEVIAKAYAEWGVQCVRRFNGMFAFAIVEHGSGRVVLARDRLGIKPLYLDHTAERLRFASTLPALLAAGGVDTSIDTVALSYYLTFNAIVPPPHTILKGVRKLPPATVRVIEPDGSTADSHYWEPSFTRVPDRADWSGQDWQASLTETLRSAVRRRLVADVPVGVLLSGGIDSSLLVALIAELGGIRVPTYSIGFVSSGDVKGDEFAYSDLVAERFATDHHRIEVGSGRLFDALDDAVSSMSEPMISPDCVAFHLLGQEVSTSIKVVQAGQGADELLGGYHWYPPLAGVARAGALDAYVGVFPDRTFEQLGALLEPEWMVDRDVPQEFLAQWFSKDGAATAVDAALRIDSQVMLVDDPVKRLDNMTMASGVEARVPFLDHEVVELAASMPPALKLADSGKGVLKRAARGLVPDEVIDRSKGYFRVPELRELDGPYLERVRQALTDPIAKERGLFRPAVVDAELADPHGNRSKLGAHALWQMGLLEMWLQSMDIR